MPQTKSPYLFPELEDLLPDPTGEAVMQRLRPGRDRRLDRKPAKALATAVATPAVRQDYHDVSVVLPLTVAEFPHVAARLALCWYESAALRGALDGLLFSERPHREGFPIAVITELTEGVRARLAELRLAGR